MTDYWYRQQDAINVLLYISRQSNTQCVRLNGCDSPSGHEVAEYHPPWVTGPAPCQPARATAHEDSGCLATELVEAISAQVL